MLLFLIAMCASRALSLSTTVQTQSGAVLGSQEGNIISWKGLHWMC